MARLLIVFASALFALCLDAAPGFALVRTYVSARGSNAAGCGTIASPCQTLQYAHNVTNVGGEVVILDSGLYGPVTITKAISIVNDGVGTATVYAGANGNAITINTANATDVVHLRGLEIDGLGVAANGVVFKGQGKLNVVRCTVRRFTGANADGAGVGILVLGNAASTVVFSIDDTIVSDNAGVGIYGVQLNNGLHMEGSINKTIVRNNNYGIDINNFGRAGNTLVVSDSVIDHNNNVGVYILGNIDESPTAQIIRTSITYNGQFGVQINYGKVILAEYLGYSAFVNNYPHVQCGTRAELYTYGDNYDRGEFSNCTAIRLLKK